VALSEAGRDAAALRIVKGLEAEAHAAAYRPLEARVLYQMGYSQILLGQSRDAERSLFDAILAAEAGADREMISLAASQLARAVGFEQSRREEGRRWARFARSSIEGTQGSPAVQVRVLNSLGSLLQRDGLYAEEEATYRQAVALAERGLGPDNPLTASVLSNLGLALLLQGRNEEAMQVSLRGLAIGRRVLPADHPNLGTSYNTVGNACTELGRKDEALAMYRKAREIFAASYGEGHPMTASADGNLGVTLKDLGRYREAEGFYRKSLAELQANGPDSPNTAIALSDLGELLVIEKRYAEALPDYQRALAINEKLLGPAHPEFAYDLRGVGDVLAGLGRTREAIPWLERALKIQESVQDAPEQLANSRYHLARALWTAGDRGRALRLAHQAYRVYAGTRGESTREMAADAAAWLRARGETP
jgi:tetratricopeptide (TPR) repeat protein